MRALVVLTSLACVLTARPVLAQEESSRASTALLLEPLERTPRPELGGGDTLGLGEVLLSVEAHHPALEILDARTDVAAATYRAAEGAFDPLLSGRASASLLGYYEYGRADVSLTQVTPLYGMTFFGGWRIGRGVDTGGIPEYYGYDETLDGGELRAGVVVPLLRDGWIDGRRAGVTRAELGVDAAEAELAARRLRMDYLAAEAYWRWVAAGLKVAIAYDLLDLAEERDDQLAARVSAGALPPIEHLENRRTVLERRQAVIAATRALERTAIALSLYLRDAEGSPVVAGPERLPLSIEPPPPTTTDEAALVTLALERRPELERLRAVRASASVAAELADNQVLPRLDLTLSASMDIGTTDDVSLASQLAPPVGEAMLVLSFPLFLREGRGRADAADAEVRAADADLELLADMVAIEVRDALSAVRAAASVLEVAEESATISRRVADGERTRFDAGATTLLVVNLREVAAAQAESALVDALADARVAHALVLAVTGSEAE